MNGILQSVTWVDAAALAVGIILVIKGFVSGASNQLARLVASAVAVGFGYFCFQPILRASNSLNLIGEHPYAAYLIAIIILFTVGVALWIIVGRLLSSALQLAIRQPFDTILGGLIGAAEAIMLIAVLCVLGLMSPSKTDHAYLFRDSKVGHFLAPALRPFAAPAEREAPPAPAVAPAPPAASNPAAPPPFVKSTRRVKRVTR